MQARMTNPAEILPDATKGIQNIYKAIGQSGTDGKVLELVHLRASQINGCSPCVFGGIKSALRSGETDERLHQVAAWRDSDLSTDAERAALEMAEAATRLADNPTSVSDEIWAAAAAQFSEKELSAIVLMIALTNLFNRINTTIRVPAGATW
ncbi:carboxymuconolactone decarboxylase family protein [Kribbella solani]|uniref:AhpD family alkylhydroperoxidase n=1 Tax=Kribbella solani TaxID=236067 RepID=A0A841DKH9_9ACTN|nr:carboxymuconolactone decarboxylase family protein [Kribbella solani]MBB5978149.1 AhpD family alkylhydroperoxidase [Kribbella solani]